MSVLGFPLPFADLPRLLVAGPMVPCRVRTVPEDFIVEEVPEAEPSGHGDQLYLWVEKRRLSAEALLRTVAEVLEVGRDEIGVAGLKDENAVTRQWVSVPARCAGRVSRLEQPGLAVLDAKLHDTKLRTGRLRANRFALVLRGDVGIAAVLAARVAELQRRCLPNYYGPQRFGHDGQTLSLGLNLLRGASASAARNGFELKLALSAAQSALFNLWMAHRVADELAMTVVDGDVVMDTGHGQLEWCNDVASTQTRFDARRVVPAGPMFGVKMRTAHRAAAGRERTVLEAAGLSMVQFARWNKLAAGTRRPMVVWPEGLEVTAIELGARLSFTLPPGSYATTLLAELGVGDA